MNKTYTYILTAAFFFTTANALTLNKTVKETIENNPQIMSNNLETKSKLYNIEVQRSGYYPTLDLNSYLEKSQTKNKRRGTSEEAWVKKDGHRSTLSLKQLLYDGSSQSSQVDESKHDYASSSFSTIEKNEEIIFKATKSYLALLEAQNIQQLDAYNTDEHNKALEIAFDQEEISGEVLESKTTQALIGNLNESKYLKKQSYIKEIAKFENITSIKPLDKLCIPTMDKIFVASTLEEAIDYALLNNNNIKKQTSLIEKQRSVLNQSSSTYKPSVQLKFDASYDHDLELAEDGNQKELNGKIDLNWNLYNGGKDKSTKEMQKIRLLEETKKLNQVKQDIIERTTVAYNSYHNSQDRLKNLRENLIVNEKILEINRNKLEDGTKTFLNVLSTQIKIVKNQEDIIKQESIYYENYYLLLKELSILTKTILLDNSDNCSVNNDVENLIIAKDNEEDDDLTLDENSSEEHPELSILGNDINLDDLTITLHFGKSLFGQDKKDKKAVDFQAKLDEISTNLLYILNKDGDKIKEIELRSYSSSEYRSKKSQADKDKANFKLAKKRVQLLREYFLNKAQNEGYNRDDVDQRLVSVPMGAKEMIMNEDGTEDQELSRRIVIKLIK